jgi:uncharacterized protein
VKFGYTQHESLPQYCRECPYHSNCWGECPKNRIVRTAEGQTGLNYLGRGLKIYFARVVPEVDKIVAELRKQPLHAQRRM